MAAARGKEAKWGMRPHSLLLSCLAALTLLSGCATPTAPAPGEIAGPRAAVQDSVHMLNRREIDFFVVSHVNGAAVPDTRTEAVEQNRGRRFFSMPAPLRRDVPADRLVTLQLLGRKEHAGPMTIMHDGTLQISGTLRVELVAGRTYFVRGHLGSTHSAIWLEDPVSGAVVGSKIEVYGAAR